MAVARIVDDCKILDLIQNDSTDLEERIRRALEIVDSEQVSADNEIQEFRQCLSDAQYKMQEYRINLQHLIEKIQSDSFRLHSELENLRQQGKERVEQMKTASISAMEAGEAAEKMHSLAVDKNLRSAEAREEADTQSSSGTANIVLGSLLLPVTFGLSSLLIGKGIGQKSDARTLEQQSFDFNNEAQKARQKQLELTRKCKDLSEKAVDQLVMIFLIEMKHG